MRHTKYASGVLLISLLIGGFTGCATTKTSIKASVVYFPSEAKVQDTCVNISIERTF